MGSDKAYTIRIKYISSFLTKGGGDIKEMLNWVNERLENNNEKTIKQRMLETCIAKLRKGDFEHSRRDEEVAPGESMFPIKVTDKKYYSWHPDLKEAPKFGSLDEDERFTLPFLTGILERYKSIPAVGKILDELPWIFNIDKKEMESSAAIIHTGPVIYDRDNDHFQEDLIQCVIKILSHISKGDWIEFNYSKVNERIKDTIFHEVAPLQIRFYENYYYLYALAKDQVSFLEFRVDHIEELRVNRATGDDDIFQYPFDWKEFQYNLNLKSRFENTLGLWIHNDADTLHVIEIEFKEWAASYIRHLKFHPSQQIIRENPSAKTIVIELRLLMKVDVEADTEKNEITIYDIEKRSTQLAFLLGRFRGFAKVLSIRKA